MAETPSPVLAGVERVVIACDADASLTQAEKQALCEQLVKKAGASPLVPVLQKPSLGTGQPLSEIAYACGFRDYTHFARKFRHRFGYSPGAAARDMVSPATS